MDEGEGELIPGPVWRLGSDPCRLTADGLLLLMLTVSVEVDQHVTFEDHSAIRVKKYNCCAFLLKNRLLFTDACYRKSM